MQNQHNENWMYLDSIENAIDSLERIIQFLKWDDNLKWKWVIIALHHALYNFCICNLEGTNYEEVLTSRKRSNPDSGCLTKSGDEPYRISEVKKRGSGYRIIWRDAKDSEVETITRISTRQTLQSIIEKSADENLIGFWTALARVQDGECYMARYTNSKAVTIDDNTWKCIEYLQNFRNKLIHFIPVGWSTNIDEIKVISSKVIYIIEDLALETNQVFYFDKKQKQRVNILFNEIKKIL